MSDKRTTHSPVHDRAARNVVSDTLHAAGGHKFLHCIAGPRTADRSLFRLCFTPHKQLVFVAHLEHFDESTVAGHTAVFASPVGPLGASPEPLKLAASVKFRFDPFYGLIGPDAITAWFEDDRTAEMIALSVRPSGFNL